MPGSPSDRRRAASAANAGFIFVLLQRVADALGVGEGCAVTASYPEVRSDHHHTNSFRTAPSLCADMIFGRDNGPFGGDTRFGGRGRPHSETNVWGVETGSKAEFCPVVSLHPLVCGHARAGQQAGYGGATEMVAEM